jgi:ribonuclease HI
VKNRDLWERLFALDEDDARDVSFVWVPGHRDEASNNIVDRLSREASKSTPRTEPPLNTSGSP